MIVVSRLRSMLGEENWVVVDGNCDPVDLDIPPDIGPATLFVSPVTDAVKHLGPDGLVESSLDKDLLWSVDAFALNRIVVQKLEGEELSTKDLYSAVTGMRLAWQFSPMPSRS